MGVRNYIYAGLDFVFDHKYRPWFLEANGSPGGAEDYRNVYNEDKINKTLSSFLNRFENVCSVISKHERLIRGVENALCATKQLEKYTKLNICYIEDNNNRKQFLMNKQGALIQPDCIYVDGHRLSNSFEKSGITVINPNCVRNLIKNKYSTLQIARKIGLRIPTTSIVKNTSELKKLLSKNHIFTHGFVIKPIKGSKGYGVHVLAEHEKLFAIRHKEILEQRILPRLIHRRYWDARVFVINGTFVGGIMRRSIHRVTNLSKGAKPEKLPRRLLQKLKSPSVKIVKTIDKEAQKLKNK